MRVLVAAIAGLAFMLAAPVQAAPAPKAAQLRGASSIQPTAADCGRGWHREWYRDGAGVQRSRCVPN